MKLLILVFLFSPTAVLAQGVSVASTNKTGEIGNGVSLFGSISADGRYLVYFSTSTNLDSRDTDSGNDVYLHDRWTGSTDLISTSHTGGIANGASVDPVISGDGQWVAFHSFASNLVPGDTNDSVDVFLHERRTGITSIINPAPGAPSMMTGSTFASISFDGSYIAFQSSFSHLVPNDTNGFMDIFVYSRETEEIRRVNQGHQGMEANGHSYNPEISANGRFVAFDSGAYNLHPQDLNPHPDVFLVDLKTNAMELVSSTPGGTSGNGESGAPAVSEDGSYVAFSSSATDLISSDFNGYSDAFFWEKSTGTVTRASESDSGVGSDHPSSAVTISADGSTLAFYSKATNLIPGGTLPVFAVFLVDTPSRTLRLASTDALGNQADGSCAVPSLSRDGRVLAFQASADLFLPDIGSHPTQIIVKETTAPSLYRKGSIPGLLEFTISGATPSRMSWFLIGQPGRWSIPGGLCQGLQLQMNQPHFGTQLPVNQDGFATWTTLVPTSMIGLRVQAIDFASCKVTHPLKLQ